MKETDFLKNLSKESDYPLTEELWQYIQENSEEVRAAKGEAIIGIGSYNPDFYIIRSGIVRGYMIENDKETNIYFGMEGTVVNSMQCFSFGEPSILRIEAAVASRFLRISKENYDMMVGESPEFCRWMSGVFSRRNAYAEKKAKIMDGDALWRYEWLRKCRPELLDNVPLKAIASYLNMTEVHVSRIRKRIADSGRWTEQELNNKN